MGDTLHDGLSDGLLVGMFVLLAAATTPPAVRFILRALGSATTVNASAAIQPDTAERLITERVLPRLAGAAQEMSDPQLSRAWRNSFWLLREAGNSAEKLALVLQRQSFLDEMEARHDEVVYGWLASGGCPSGGPEQFIYDDGDDHASERRHP